MGTDYLGGDEGGTLVLSLKVHDPNSRGNAPEETKSIGVDVPPDGKVYVEALMDGDVTER